MTCQEDKATRTNLEEDTIEDSKYYSRQIFSSSVAILSTIVTGMTMGYSAVLLPQLKLSSNVLVPDISHIYLTNDTVSEDNDITVRTNDEESWIAASAALAMAPGCWMATFLISKIGRKASFLVINPIAFVGWLILALSRNLVFLITGRLLCGLCVGFLGATSSVYITEISHPRLRGLLLAVLSLAVALGIFFVHALGTWLHWRLTAYITAIIPIISFIIGFYVSESPIFLLSQGKREDALAIWTLLRGDHSISEFPDLKGSQEVSTLDNSFDPPGQESTRKNRVLKSSGIGRLWNRRFLVSLSIVCAFFFVSQFSGINVVTFYCVQMFQEISEPNNAYLGTLVLDFVRVVVCGFACWLTRRYPRRILAISSSVGTSLTLLVLSGCLFADFGRPWLTVSLLFIYTATLAIGLVPLPWLLCAELFDSHTRGLGSGISTGFAFLCFFAVVKTGPLALDVLTPGGTFALYGTVALLGSVFLHLYLPETKDKTLRDIENVFVHDTYVEDDESTRNVTRL